MNFGGISAYEQNIKNVDGADGSAISSKPVSAVKAANAAALGDAREGQVVTGEVASVNGRTVKLTLPDSQVVTARLEADVKVSVGESMAFTVKSNTGSQIALKPLFNSSAVNATAIKALGQASILVDANSLAMASAMMDEGLPIGRESMQAMYRQVNRFPDANPADIVAMSKQGLPLTPDMVEQFSAYRNNEHQIMMLAEDISESLADAADELGYDAKYELSGIFDHGGEPDASALMKQGLDDMAHQAQAALAEAAMEAIPEEKPAGILDVAAKLHASAEAAEVPVEEELVEAEEIAVAAEEESEPDTPLARLMDRGARQELADALKGLGAPEADMQQLVSGQMTPERALQYMRGAMKLDISGELDSLSLSDEAKAEKHALVKQIADSPAFKNLLKDAVVRDFSLSNDGDISREKVHQLYEKILRDSGRVMQLLEQFGKEDSPLAKQLTNVNNNINFMNQLNETFQYVQLPIQMSGENAHGDLYVYTNKKKLAEKDGDITALLHLEMETMGTMDIHVTLKDLNKVNTHFMLANDEMLDFVSENIHILNERLEARGYSMTTDAEVKTGDDKNKNPAISAMLGGGQEHKGRMISKFSFDVKA